MLLSKPLIHVDSRFAGYVASPVSVALLFTADALRGGITHIFSAPGWERLLSCIAGELNSGA